MTITPKITFATGDPVSEYGDKEMFAADVGGGTIAEMYARQELYSDTLRAGFALKADLKLAFHRYKPGSKVYREWYIAGQDLLAPVLYRWGPKSGAVETDQWTGEDSRAPSAEFNIPIFSVGFKYSY